MILEPLNALKRNCFIVLKSIDTFDESKQHLF